MTVNEAVTRRVTVLPTRTESPVALECLTSRGARTLPTHQKNEIVSRIEDGARSMQIYSEIPQQQNLSIDVKDDSSIEIRGDCMHNQELTHFEREFPLPLFSDAKHVKALLTDSGKLVIVVPKRAN
jgi:hypothetical protein